MSRDIRIGTRGSALALWQARWVQTLLSSVGLSSELVPIESSGDIQQQKPLYEMGIQGVFTKELDTALLAKEVDIAVHSMKDVPTKLPQGIVTAFVPKRGPWQDVLVVNKEDWQNDNSQIATSSLRRSAQWLYTFPTHTLVDIRGNVPTRLKKLNTSSWHGSIMALAGLERLDMLPKNSVVLDWMIPAPAQGAISVTTLESHSALLKKVEKLKHAETAFCVEQERQFLRMLEGGCTAPIGAHAQVVPGGVHFRGNVTHKEGKAQLVFEKLFPLGSKDIGGYAAKELLKQGAKELLNG